VRKPGQAGWRDRQPPGTAPPGLRAALVRAAAGKAYAFLQPKASAKQEERGLTGVELVISAAHAVL